MAMKPALQAKLGASLALTPQLQQAIRLLQLSQLELEAELQAAVDANPMLTLDAPDPGREEAPSDGDPVEADTAAPDVGGDDPEADEELPLDDWSTDDLPRGADADADAGLPDATESAAAADGLHEHLRWQLGMALRSPRDLVIADALVDALDEDGYLREPLEAVAGSLPGIAIDEIRAVLRLLQQCDPVGCGARDLAECLILQLGTLAPEVPGLALARHLVDGHLEALARQRPATLAEALGVPPGDVDAAAALIRGLDPRPGARLAPAATEYVQPDAIAIRRGGRWTVRMTRTPRLGLDRHYEGLIGRCRREDDAWLRGQLQEARWLIRALEHRGDTLRRVAEAIVAAQSGFLDHGPGAMRPLTLRAIAEPLGLHESTVSRATTRKYLRTPRGTFEFKHFFGVGLPGGDAGATSATAVQDRLRRMIEAEEPDRPLSDQALADRLGAEGIVIARRTVAKYREGLGIAPSSERGRR
ncbi:MAG: RNA polymerase factor sigma-54 [Lysobacteraceae bacterium]